MNALIQLAERGYLTDSLIRIGIRRLLAGRLRSLEAVPRSTHEWIRELESCPLAESTDAANAQHYEIPAAYFKAALGKHLKYSSGFWPEGCHDLDAAEEAMLRLTCERAELADGQRILELGCGWGSLSLWMAGRYPEASIVSVSNSRSQREYIEGQARERGLANLEVVTADINAFAPDGQFDRVVSVEMFEHVRNHRELMNRIHDWLRPGGKLFVHIFAHREQTYLFQPVSAKDWMSRYFFTGGIMPSADLLPTAAERLREVQRWEVNGRHYSRTLEAWLQKQDAARGEILDTFRKTYGREARLWFQRWRIFYMACSELFAYRSGTEWMVMHYLFARDESK